MDKAPDAFRTISEVAEELDLPQHVLRFWETRFSQIKPLKRGGGRRYYRPDDVDLLRGIRHLLYGEGYTIRGVQRILKDHGIKFVQTVWQAGAPQPAPAAADLEEGEDVGERAEGERGRGLLALLPAFLGSEESAAAGRPQPPPADVTASGQAPTAGENGPQRTSPQAGNSSPKPPKPGAPDERAGLAREDLAKLSAVLTELAECRRLLDDVLLEKS